MRRNKLRTALTGFSVAWGIFMLVILLGSGNGLKNGVESYFGGYTSKPYAGYEKIRRIQLKTSDITTLKRDFSEVDEVSAQAWYDSKKATCVNDFTSVWVCGMTPTVARMEGIKLSVGSSMTTTCAIIARSSSSTK